MKRVARMVVAFLVLLLLAWVGLAIHFSNRPLPDGLRVEGSWHAVEPEDVRFLVDWTAPGPGEGERVVEQTVFDQVFADIAGARRLVLVDFFLINRFAGGQPDHPAARDLSGELGQALAAARVATPDLLVVAVTDPLNTVYGGVENEILADLGAAGVPVVMTDLRALPDSNLVYSPWWRTILRHVGSARGEALPNPLGEGRIGWAALLELLNFKANHRKVLVADDGADGLIGLVTSANPHSASSLHGNVALRFRGPAVRDLVAAEAAVLRFSGAPDLADQVEAAAAGFDPPVREETGARLRILSEGAIPDALLAAIDGTGSGDTVRVAMFYFADRPLIAALQRAAARGARVQVLLDPNKDAFGREKSGVPNRQTAAALHGAGIPVRWAATRGEQFHTKMLLIDRADGPCTLNLGSSNWTRRNLHDFNLELNVEIEAPEDFPALRDARATFERAWSDSGASPASLPYEAYADESALRKVQAGLMEKLGAGTF